MKHKLLLASVFAGSAYLLPTVLELGDATYRYGPGQTAYDFMETARLPTHIHPSNDVTCRLDKENGTIRLTNHASDEVRIIPAAKVFDHHYRGQFNKDYSVHVVEKGHLFADEICFEQKDMPVLPLAIQMEFRLENAS